MPSISFISNGLTALNLWTLTNSLEGDDAQFKARERVRAKILAAWPELAGVGLTAEEEAERQEQIRVAQRPVEINPFEQTALAEGMLKWIKDLSKKDGEKSAVLDLAKRCKFSKWLDKQIDKKELREFTESDDEVETDPPGTTEEAVAKLAADLDEVGQIIRESVAERVAA